jgi:hypothetical protein
MISLLASIATIGTWIRAHPPSTRQKASTHTGFSMASLQKKRKRRRQDGLE